MLIIYADGALLHHSAIGDKYNAIYEKKLKTEVNKAGSFEFVMPPTHALYDSLERFKTKIQIWQDSTMLFDGRVLEINDTINNERKVYCEGNLSYLLDSLAAPYEGTMTVSAYLTKRIQEHNAQVEADKRFTLRTIDAELGAKTVDTQSTSYTDTRADLDENIINVYGGFLVTENQNGTLYLDYLKTIDVLGDQPLEFGFNLTDFTKNTPSTDVYSILLPTGDDDLTIESVNGGSKYIENATLIQKFGRIYHQESFNGISSAAELLSEATEYFNRVAQSILTPTFSIQVADFSNYTDGYAPFVVGRKYKMLSPAGEMCIYQAYTIDYDLDTFGNTTIEFVDPATQNLSLNRRRSIGSRNSSSAASSKRAGSGGKSSGINLKYYHEGNDSAKIIASDIGLESSSTHIAVKDKFSLIATDSDWAEFVENGGVGSILEVDPHGFRSITGLLTSAFGKFKGADGTAILQNMEAITQFAGQFTVDSEGVVRLKDGASLMVKKDGVYSQVGTVTEIDTVDGRVDEMQGTTFWQNRDSITQTAGKFQIDAQGNLHIIDGSGLYLGTGQGSLAVYKEGDITARFIVDQINGGTATIQGNHVNINANTDFTATAKTVNLVAENGYVRTRLAIECGNVTISGGNLVVDGYVSAAAFEAEQAKLNDLMAGQAQASTISTQTLRAGNAYAANLFLNNEEFAKHNIYMGGTTVSGFYLGDANLNLAHYHAITATENNGVITITQGAAQDTAGSDSFNIADTNFYKAAVASAESSGKAAMGLVANAESQHVTVTESATKNIAISAGVSFGTYNRTTHKYPISGTASAGGTLMDTASGFTDDSAYEHGWDVGYAVGVNDGYKTGWNAAVAAITRNGNSIIGPAASNGSNYTTETKYTANYTPSAYTPETHKYTPSTYVAETHSYTASSYTAEQTGTSTYTALTQASSYDASSHTNASMTVNGKTYTSSTSVPLVKYTGAAAFNKGTYHASSYTKEKTGTGYYTYLSKASSYTPSSHSYVASVYDAETHSYTASSYTASSFSWS